MSDLSQNPSQMPQYPGSGYTGASPPSFSGEGGASPELPAPLVDANEPAGIIEIPPSKFRKFTSIAAWTTTGLVSLIIFTFLKLPEDRVKGLIQGNIAAALANKGVTLTADQTSMGILMGPSYIMKDVTLNLPPPAAPAHIDKIEIAPSFSALLTGKLGARISIENGDGKIFLMGAVRGTKVSVLFEADKMNLGKIGAFYLLSSINGSTTLTGKGSFSTDMDALNETDGELQLDLDKIVIDQQSISGFPIPKLAVSSGRVELDVNQGRGTLKALNIGKKGSSTDDIMANASGDITLGKTLNSSTINLHTNFALSQSLLKSFSLLEAILGNAKQPDGSFSYHLAGPLLAPNPTPVGPNGS
jgi:type II secretion system protein N